jgi:hypothetical protein
MLPVKTGKLTRRTYSFVIDSRDLEDGISQFTLFTGRGEPVCERLIFKYPENQFLITAETNAEYKTRDKINVNLSALDQAGKPVTADMSMAVYRIDSLQNPDESNIRDYMYLSAELGPLNLRLFISKRMVNRARQIWIILMLTHGWRRYNWKELIRQKPVNIEFPLPNTTVIL